MPRAAVSSAPPATANGFSPEDAAELSRAVLAAAPGTSVVCSTPTSACCWRRARCSPTPRRSPPPFGAHSLRTMPRRSAVRPDLRHHTAGDSRTYHVQVTPMHSGGTTSPAWWPSSRTSDRAPRRRPPRAERGADAPRRAARRDRQLGDGAASGAAETSEGLRALLGSRRTRSPTSRFLTFVLPEDRERVVRTMTEDMTAGGVYECEFRIRRVDGVVRDVIARAQAVARDDGSLVLRGTTLDVTERNAADAARGEFEAMFRQGFDGAPIGMALTDPVSGRFLRMNGAMVRLLGSPREELMKLTLLEMIHLEDLPEGLDIRGALMERAAGHLRGGAAIRAARRRHGLVFSAHGAGTGIRREHSRVLLPVRGHQRPQGPRVAAGARGGGRGVAGSHPHRHRRGPAAAARPARSSTWPAARWCSTSCCCA